MTDTSINDLIEVAPSSRNETTAHKRGRGAPHGNRNHETHGFHPAKAALMRYGKRAVNLRTRGGREYKSLYVTFLSQRTHIPIGDLRTAKQIRNAEKTLPKDSLLEVEALASNGWLVHFLNAEVVRLPSIVRRDKTLVPLIAERDARLASYEKRREEFQQRYKKRAPTLADIFRQRSAERTANTPSTIQPTELVKHEQEPASQAAPAVPVARAPVSTGSAVADDEIDDALPQADSAEFEVEEAPALSGAWRDRLERRRRSQLGQQTSFEEME